MYDATRLQRAIHVEVEEETDLVVVGVVRESGNDALVNDTTDGHSSHGLHKLPYSLRVVHERVEGAHVRDTVVCFLVDWVLGRTLR